MGRGLLSDARREAVPASMVRQRARCPIHGCKPLVADIRRDNADADVEVAVNKANEQAAIRDDAQRRVRELRRTRAALWPERDDAQVLSEITWLDGEIAAALAAVESTEAHNETDELATPPDPPRWTPSDPDEVCPSLQTQNRFTAGSGGDDR